MSVSRSLVSVTRSIVSLGHSCLSLGHSYLSFGHSCRSFSFLQQLREVYGAFLEKALGGGASGDVKAAWDTFLGYLQDVLAAEEKKK